MTGKIRSILLRVGTDALGRAHQGGAIWLSVCGHWSLVILRSVVYVRQVCSLLPAVRPIVHSWIPIFLLGDRQAGMHKRIGGRSEELFRSISIHRCPKTENLIAGERGCIRQDNQWGTRGRYMISYSPSITCYYKSAPTISSCFGSIYRTSRASTNGNLQGSGRFSAPCGLFIKHEQAVSERCSPCFARAAAPR